MSRLRGIQLKRTGRAVRRAVVAVALSLGMFAGGVALAAPAYAIWWQPEPPYCHTDNRWHWVGEGRDRMPLYYGFAWSYWTESQSSRGVIHRQRYVYDVQNVMYPYGMITVGRAEKECASYRT